MAAAEACRAMRCLCARARQRPALAGCPHPHVLGYLQQRHLYPFFISVIYSLL